MTRATGAPGPPPFYLGAARVSLDELDAQLAALRPGEGALGPRATPKRRAERAAGRRAAHEALARMCGSGADRWRVIRTEAGEHLGRPVVTDVDGDLVGVFVSITHSGDAALAVAARVPMGVDLTPIEERGDAFAREAFVEGEVAAWRAQLRDEATATSFAFAAKEAVLKWLGVGFGIPLGAIATRPGRVAGTVAYDGVELQCSVLELSYAGIATTLSCWRAVYGGCALCIARQPDTTPAFG